MNSRFLLALLVLCGVSALAWFSGGFFRSTEVCATCGARQNVRTTMWIPTAVFQETPLSIYLKSLRHGSPHDHDWMLVAGSGGPIRCALGRGREIQQASRSNEIVDALKLIRLHRGDTEAHVWTKRLLNPTASASARQALCYLGEGAGDFDVDYTLAVEEFEGSERANPL